MILTTILAIIGWLTAIWRNLVTAGGLAIGVACLWVAVEIYKSQKREGKEAHEQQARNIKTPEESEFRKRLLDSLSNSYPEIRFMKGQQFSTTYYTLLLFAALIALFQVDVVLPPVWFEGLRWGSLGLVVVLAFVAVVYQVDHFRSLQQYRGGLPYMESLSREARERELRKKCWQAIRYTGPFILITILGAFAAGVVIYFRRPR